MPTMARRRSLHSLLALAVLVTGIQVLVHPLAPAGADSVRKQIKIARRDLVAFERELTTLVSTFESLQEQHDALSGSIRTARSALNDLSRPKDLYEHAWASFVLRPVIRQSLEEAKTRAAIIAALLPELRKQIWNKGLERKDKIQALDDAIEFLQSARSGKLITKAGVDGGQLITYSADWATVAQCESSGRWHIDDYFDGGLQFLPSTWWGFGGGAYGHYAYEATRRQQIDIAERVLAVQGPKAWPNCFAALPADTDE